MPNQKGAVQLLPLLVILAIVAAVAFFLITNKLSLPQTVSDVLRPFKAPGLPLRTEYKNPLDKASQYVNPFSSYKNPFDFLK